MRYALMLALALIALAAMGLTLLWFFRRLRRIETARWGDRKDRQGSVNVH